MIKNNFLKILFASFIFTMVFSPIATAQDALTREQQTEAQRQAKQEEQRLKQELNTAINNFSSSYKALKSVKGEGFSSLPSLPSSTNPDDYNEAYSAAGKAVADLLYFANNSASGSDVSAGYTAQQAQTMYEKLTEAKDAMSTAYNNLISHQQANSDKTPQNTGVNSTGGGGGGASLLNPKTGEVVNVDETGQEVSGASKECASIGSRAGMLKKCLFCKLFTALFNAASSMTSQSASTFGSPFANLVAIGMALFIAFETMKMVSSFTQQDIRKYLNTVGIQMTKAAITFYLLKDMGTFYNYIINPMLMAGFDFGSAILGGSSSMSLANSGATISSSIGSTLIAFVQQCQQEAVRIVALGQYLGCFAWNEGEGFFPILQLIIRGLIFQGMGWLIVMSFGFLLIDAVVQLGIFGALAPFCLAAWPFKITSSYTKSGWQIFSGVFLTFAMAGVTLKIVMELVGGALGGGFDQIVDTADHGTKDQLLAILNAGGSSILICIAAAIIGFRLTGKISDLVSTFGGDAGPKIGSDIGKQAMTAGNRALTSAGNAVGSAAKAVSDASGLTELGQKAKAKAHQGFNYVVGAPKRLIQRKFGNTGSVNPGGGNPNGGNPNGGNPGGGNPGGTQNNSNNSTNNGTTGGTQNNSTDNVTTNGSGNNNGNGDNSTNGSPNGQGGNP